MSELVPGEDGGGGGGLDVVHGGLGNQEVSGDDLLGGDGLAHALGHLDPGVAALVADVLTIKTVITTNRLKLLTDLRLTHPGNVDCDGLP